MRGLGSSPIGYQWEVTQSAPIMTSVVKLRMRITVHAVPVSGMSIPVSGSAV